MGGVRSGLEGTPSQRTTAPRPDNGDEIFRLGLPATELNGRRDGRSTYQFPRPELAPFLIPSLFGLCEANHLLTQAAVTESGLSSAPAHVGHTDHKCPSKCPEGHCR